MDKALNMGRIEADKRVVTFQPHARIYCAKMGFDPDDVVTVPHPQLAGVSLKLPTWYTIAERMFELTTLLLSISEGNAKQKAANGTTVVAGA